MRPNVILFPYQPLHIGAPGSTQQCPRALLVRENASNKENDDPDIMIFTAASPHLAEGFVVRRDYRPGEDPAPLMWR